jgi:hypothetical protein
VCSLGRSLTVYEEICKEICVQPGLKPDSLQGDLQGDLCAAISNESCVRQSAMILVWDN